MLRAESSNRVANTAIEGLLERNQECLGEEFVRERIHRKVVMVTGAAGSIGSELCRQIARFGPLALIGFDQAETQLFRLDSDLSERLPGLLFHSKIGNVARFDDVSRTIDQYRPSIVFHAAAYKHVPMLEKRMFAAVENNIFGTWNVAQAAASHGVESFVLISSDKAVCPSSMMGATKRVAELAIRALGKQRRTKFVAVRFGNVLGSSGSVVPIFKSQIATGGPVTVTHPDMRRYFMTASEAGQLVLQALVLGKGGEIFVLDMGEPLSIVALARSLILLSGLHPGRDIEIVFTGVRPGEKLVEELHKPDEQLIPTARSRIYNLQSSDDVDATQFTAFLEDLKMAVGERDALGTIHLLKEMVPDYIPSPQLIEHAMSLQKIHGIADDIQDSSTESIERMLVTSK
ncbi:MAG: polysaccharide biosynthesis protein [Terracidiphilus sp.]